VSFSAASVAALTAPITLPSSLSTSASTYSSQAVFPDRMHSLLRSRPEEGPPPRAVAGSAGFRAGRRGAGRAGAGGRGAGKVTAAAAGSQQPYGDIASPDFALRGDAPLSAHGRSICRPHSPTATPAIPSPTPVRIHCSRVLVYLCYSPPRPFGSVARLHSLPRITRFRYVG
jgi:hypothetical protein